MAKKVHPSDGVFEQVERNSASNKGIFDNPYGCFNLGSLASVEVVSTPSEEVEPEVEVTGSKRETKTTREPKAARTPSGKKERVQTKDCIRYAIYFTPEEYVRLDIVTAYYSEKNGRTSKQDFIKKMIETGLKKTDPQYYEIFKKGLGK